MSSEVVLNAELRTQTAKHAKYTRSQGMIPGVYYARGEQNLNIQVQTVSLNKLVFTSEAHVIDLRLNDGSSRRCILRDVQFDPVTDRPVHFDLQGLKENEKITMDIPVVLVGGTPKGVRDGGMVQHVIHKVRISCLPKDMPEKIEVNIAELGINDMVHISDLSVPNVTILDNPEGTVVGVMPPSLVKEEAPAEATEEAMKEPEVVGKGKKAEEGEEGGEASEGKDKEKEKEK